MQIKTSVFKRKARTKKVTRKDGSIHEVKIKGGWVYRIRYTAANGRPKTEERGFFDLKNQAKDAMNEAARKIEITGGEIGKGERLTFNDLADICEKEFYRPAVIVEGKRIAGVRSDVSARALISNLRAYFGKMRINNISGESLIAYRLHRVKPRPPKKPGGKPRVIKLATVNRELSILRKMLKHAFAKGWTLRDVFYKSNAIDKGFETARDRTLSRAEETRLLAACSGEWETSYTREWNGEKREVTAHFRTDNDHLRAMIILALDSGMRRGEILKLRWQDIDFENKRVRILGTHTKTERERLAPLSDRAASELLALRQNRGTERPFPFVDIKRSFATAKRLAGIKDLRFHDLRRTAITRWVQQGTPLDFAGSFAGHSQLQTTKQYYVKPDVSALAELNERMNAYHSTPELSAVPLESDLVN